MRLGSALSNYKVRGRVLKSLNTGLNSRTSDKLVIEIPTVHSIEITALTSPAVETELDNEYIANMPIHPTMISKISSILRCSTRRTAKGRNKSSIKVINKSRLAITLMG